MIEEWLKKLLTCDPTNTYSCISRLVSTFGLIWLVVVIIAIIIGILINEEKKINSK